MYFYSKKSLFGLKKGVIYGKKSYNLRNLWKIYDFFKSKKCSTYKKYI